MYISLGSNLFDSSSRTLVCISEGLCTPLVSSPVCGVCAMQIELWSLRFKWAEIAWGRFRHGHTAPHYPRLDGMDVLHRLGAHLHHAPSTSWAILLNEARRAAICPGPVRRRRCPPQRCWTDVIPIRARMMGSRVAMPKPYHTMSAHLRHGSHNSICTCIGTAPHTDQPTRGTR